MEGIEKMPDKMDNLAHALNNLHNALSALAVDYSATGNMSETVGRQITLDLHLAGVELCEYWKIEDGIHEVVSE